jgi:hypothetical protein
MLANWACSAQGRAAPSRSSQATSSQATSSQATSTRHNRAQQPGCNRDVRSDAADGRSHRRFRKPHRDAIGTRLIAGIGPGMRRVCRDDALRPAWPIRPD